MSPRPRERILENLERVYREAYDLAKQAGDEHRMRELDASFQREQLLLEVLLDVRDGLYAVSEASSPSSALEKLDVLRRLTRLR
jgi:hypothetical protein